MYYKSVLYFHKKSTYNFSKKDNSQLYIVTGNYSLLKLHNEVLREGGYLPTWIRVFKTSLRKKTVFFTDQGEILW